MISKHSNTVTFDFEFKGEMHPCSFYIYDGRLLTVSVPGRRKTVELGSTPPLALAESIAAELLSDSAGSKPAPTPEPHSKSAAETAMEWFLKSGHSFGFRAASAH